MITASRFFGSGAYFNILAPTTSVKLPAPNRGGWRFVNLKCYTNPFTVYLPWMSEEAGAPASLVNIQIQTGGPVFLLRVDASPRGVDVRDQTDVLVATIAHPTPGKGVLLYLEDRAGYAGTWRAQAVVTT
uniref:Uncharacterized protein n=1 Tax=viral metagenome TaxID=1070528 RepID=A0A6M3J8X4_9ZZZZ